MKILHISTYDRGGAAKACIRLHESLVTYGYDSTILFLYSSGTSVKHAHTYSMNVKEPVKYLTRLMSKVKRLFFKNASKQEVLKKEALKKEIKTLIPHTIEWFSFPDTGFDITTQEVYKQADIIHLHWVSDFLDYSFFKKNKKPVIWTLHDMNPFSGGCHYAGNSKGFQRECLNCPQLQETSNPDYAAQILHNKEQYMRSVKNISIITPSVWLGKESQSSTAFAALDHYVIPYGIDSQIYHPVDERTARQELGLSLDKKIILFVSDSLETPRKGFSYLLSALEQLYTKEEYILCLLGSTKEKMDFGIGFTTNTLGYIYDERIMSYAYSAANVFIIPSLMDNFPNTVLESLMCGTPVIGFPVGGIPDAVMHGKNGLVCEEVTAEALAQAIRLFFDKQFMFDPTAIRKDAIERFDLKVQVDSYADLYSKIIK